MSNNVFYGIPIPPARRRGPVSGPLDSATNDLRQLDLNGVRYFPITADEDAKKIARRVNSTVQRARATDKSKKFTVRPTNHHETGEPCLGVWRVA